MAVGVYAVHTVVLLLLVVCLCTLRKPHTDLHTA
jgi:hypothetical protein